MESTQRIEHLFVVVGGRAHIFPGLSRAVSVVVDGGALLVYLPPGLTPRARAETLAAAMLIHLAARIDPRELLALLHRAFRDSPPPRVPSSTASVAIWIPGGE